MRDYILRDAAIALLKKWADGYSYIETPTEDAINEFNAIPAADVRPVKEGEWIADKFQYLNCSECGCDTNLYDQHGFPIGQRKGDPYPRFCPHCGAKMGGATNGIC